MKDVDFGFSALFIALGAFLALVIILKLRSYFRADVAERRTARQEFDARLRRDWITMLASIVKIVLACNQITHGPLAWLWLPLLALGLLRSFYRRPRRTATSSRYAAVAQRTATTWRRGRR